MSNRDNQFIVDKTYYWFLNGSTEIEDWSPAGDIQSLEFRDDY